MDRADIRDAWDDVAATYAAKRDPGGDDAALLEDLLASLPSEPLVLDVGCGDGARTLANLPADAVGLDFSRAGLNLAREASPPARLLQADMVHLPVRADAVDAVTAYHAVFHVPRSAHDAVYREFARVLRPGGHLLMSLPSGRFETVRHGWMGGSMFFTSPGRAATLERLSEAGFSDLRTRTVGDPLGSSAEFVFATAGSD